MVNSPSIPIQSIYMSKVNGSTGRFLTYAAAPDGDCGHAYQPSSQRQRKQETSSCSRHRPCHLRPNSCRLIRKLCPSMQLYFS
ncbi:hypothetical protein XACW160_430066 [Xanthomonas citri pv. citri]|nr:hypothetical protein XAC9322_430046 [Xanthomonas citri pv. citri]CEE28590.1 hypothetical protein XAC1083_430048 [Xanthomonas citri pv. citri]CEE64871.1 hypothetical protein XACW160_430066 [Xanthomonas citri pv. citri]CEE70381.1 hypothetical protein XAC2852_470047 [Xanthomonas citri pv. citri]CEH53714.1 hypothetical protein XACG102_5240008 [Xanthomonas citri pv. citri]